MKKMIIERKNYLLIENILDVLANGGLSLVVRSRR